MPDGGEMDQAPRPLARTRPSAAMTKRPHSPDPVPDPLPQCKRARMPIGNKACGIRCKPPPRKAHGIPAQPHTRPSGKKPPPCIPRNLAPWPIGKARPPATVKKAMVPTPPNYPPPIGMARVAKPPARERRGEEQQ